MVSTAAHQAGTYGDGFAGATDSANGDADSVKLAPLWVRMLVDLPSRIGVLLLVTIVVACLTTLADAFSAPIVLPLIALGVAATWRITPDPIAPTRIALIGSTVAIASVTIWIAANAYFTSETLYVERDPGFLALQGVWASQSADPGIPIRTALEATNAVPQTTASAPAFNLVGTSLYSQGAKSLPALLGMFGWASGVTGVLVANVVLGGAALLAFYDCARRLMGTVSALLPLAILALSMPFGYFTRTPFTEPVNLALLVSGVSMLWAAVREPRIARFAASGALIGATALNRIDGAAAVIGLLLGMGAVIALNDDPSRRRPLGLGLVASGASAVAMVLLGYFDLRTQSPVYLSDLASQYRLLIAGLIVSGIGATSVYFISGVAPVRSWIVRNRSRLAIGVASGSALLIVFLLSRPLWMTSNHVTLGTPYARLVGGLQEAEGLDIDPTRSYDEMTLTWIAWYVGWITVAFGLVAFVVMLHRSIRHENPLHLVFLVVLGVPSLLYIWRVAITPDQIWAMRRLLPTAIPLIILLAAWLVTRALNTRGLWPVGAVAVSLLMLVSPITTWKTLVGVADFEGTYQEVSALCDAVGDSRVVSIRPGGHTFLPTTRVVCGVDTVEIDGTATRDTLTAIASVWSETPITVVTRYPDAVPWSVPPAPYRVGSIARWENSLSAPPEIAVDQPAELWLGILQKDGSVVPLVSPPN